MLTHSRADDAQNIHEVNGYSRYLLHQNLTPPPFTYNLGGRSLKRKETMIEPYKSKASTGAKKAIGQLKKVIQMIEGDEYCMDIIQQVRAAEGLLNSLSSNLLESHLQTCGSRAFSSKDKKQHQKIIDELVVAFKAAKK